MGGTVFSGGFYLIGVPVVKGIIFGYDAGDFHGCFPPCVCRCLLLYQFLKKKQV
jgi:hypothetical protein